jgi:hypothetical protein
MTSDSQKETSLLCLMIVIQPYVQPNKANHHHQVSSLEHFSVWQETTVQMAEQRICNGEMILI